MCCDLCDLYEECQEVITPEAICCTECAEAAGCQGDMTAGRHMMDEDDIDDDLEDGDGEFDDEDFDDEYDYDDDDEYDYDDDLDDDEYEPRH